MRHHKTDNIEVFKQTYEMCQKNKTLTQSVQSSIQHQKVYFDQNVVELKQPKSKAGKVIVSKKRSLEASQAYMNQNKKVCVLNFASAMNPGGGVVRGANAQEEAICRCSSLYPCINDIQMWKEFYFPHRQNLDCLHNDDCIYTPNVKVFKTDTKTPVLLDEENWWDVDVMTCAAPNLRNLNLEDYDDFELRLKQLFQKRIDKIFKIAIENNVDVLILGAFGCGAFLNPPVLVAEVFAACTQKYRHYFDRIEYAIYCNSYETTNYQVFKKMLSQ